MTKYTLTHTSHRGRDRYTVRDGAGRVVGTAPTFWLAVNQARRDSHAPGAWRGSLKYTATPRPTEPDVTIEWRGDGAPHVSRA